MIRRVVLGVALWSGAALADADRAILLPTRDVDVTYRSVQPDGRVLDQGFRWRAADRIARVRLPSGGVEMLMDYRTRHVSVMHLSEHTSVEVDDAVPPPPGGADEASYRRRGTARVAGVECTMWDTRDEAGRATQVCITADGVLLRAGQDGQVLIEAVSVSYAAQDAASFHVPAGWTRTVGVAK